MPASPVPGFIATVAMAAALLTAPALHAQGLGAESAYGPSGQAVTPPRHAPTPERGGRAVVVTPGPVVVLPGHPAMPPRHPVVWGGCGRYLPVRCLRTYSFATGTLRLFEARCLEDAGVTTRDLPPASAVTVRVGGQVIEGYDPVRLREAGYRMAGD